MRVILRGGNVERVIDTTDSKLLGEWLNEFFESLDLTHGPSYAWPTFTIEFR